ncbi:hypothetical protein MLD38_003065 [Melastoma candidum]|uniref:Uncharacterized protein n=1 Tax=Melastoma candidum TaxID=119954 RepID=A0ACB9S115_9MYRT|nr:hypothetical protein MLD38_003065 [Melastoma candidum]
MEMHHHLLHPTASSSDFDSIFAGVSLQSLLLGDPVLLTPPPPPFPPSPDPLPHHLPLPPQYHPSPPTFSFRAAEPCPSADKRRPLSRRNQAPHPPRRRTQKVSEKLKALRRIVPCDHKADIATMLEQAYKYVRYLEAQVLALLTMQLCTPDERGLCSGVSGGGTGEIERRMIESVGRLSRKEVVEAVVNSGTAQKVLYEEGLCLVSEEQVRVLALSAFQRQQQQQQQLSGLICAANACNNYANTTTNNSSSNVSYSYPPFSHPYS